MGQRLWLVVLVVGTLAFGCEKKPAAPGPPPGPAPRAEVAPAPPAEAPAAEAPPAEAPAAEKEVLFSEDFESGEPGPWTGVTIVEGGAGESKFAAQGTVGKNPEYWGVDLTVDDQLTLSLDLYLDGPPSPVQVITFAKEANDNFRYELGNLTPGRWHHVEVKVAKFFSWQDGSLVGDTMQNLNIWVQGPEGSTFRFDNVVLYR